MPSSAYVAIYLLQGWDSSKQDSLETMTTGVTSGLSASSLKDCLRAIFCAAYTVGSSQCNTCKQYFRAVLPLSIKRCTVRYYSTDELSTDAASNSPLLNFQLSRLCSDNFSHIHISHDLMLCTGRKFFLQAYDPFPSELCSLLIKYSLNYFRDLMEY